MKSGDYSQDRNDEHFRSEFTRVTDPHFVRQTFSTRRALVAKAVINGYRHIQDYHGEAYDPKEYDLVDGEWDHEHCSICTVRIVDGQTYWENGRRVILLCDACYDWYNRPNHRIRCFPQARLVRGTRRAIVSTDQFNVSLNLLARIFLPSNLLS